MSINIENIENIPPEIRVLATKYVQEILTTSKINPPSIFERIENGKIIND
jgi:hypothetical protein